MKIHPVGTKFFHADRRTNRHTDEHDKASSFFFFGGWTCVRSELYRREEGKGHVLSQWELVGKGPEEPFLLFQPIGDTQIV